MSHHSQKPTFVRRLQEFSIPLFAGVIVALIAANTNESYYQRMIHDPLPNLVAEWCGWSISTTPTASEVAPAPETFTESKNASVSDTHETSNSTGDEQILTTTVGLTTSSNTLNLSTDSLASHSKNAQLSGHQNTNAQSKYPAHSDHATAHTNSHEATPYHEATPSHEAATSHEATTSHEAHSGDDPSHGHSIFSLAFIINDIFMVFFFGIAAKEITEACLPGGSLNPPSKAINPLFATVGGVLGPIAVFLGLNAMFGQADWTRGWGIPTATDIALAWLAARLIFGKGHPAISFLLLLAIADDAIGLGIIAFAYPDPLNPVQWAQTAWIIPGLLAAFTMRKANVRYWLPYVAIAGGFCWWGLYAAHLHPALALVFVVPFIPGPKKDHGLYVDAVVPTKQLSPLEKFEHDIKLGVDFGLFFFAFCNAGVPFSGITNLTWIIFTSLLLGKTIGITMFSWLAVRIGFPLPAGLSPLHLLVTSMIAGLGLTVALFVSNQAFVDPQLAGAAKMGALFSAAAAGFAYATSRLAGSKLLQKAWFPSQFVTKSPSTR